MKERIQAAEMLRREVGTTLDSVEYLVDPMENEANISYGGFPERLFIILDGGVVYEGGVGPMYYNLQELVQNLNKLIN